jgi:hypothetical protein
MNPAFKRFKESPVTKSMGFFLFILVSIALYNGKFELLYSGVTLYGLSLSLLLLSTRQIKGFLTQAVKTALDFLKKSAPIFLVFLFVACGVSKQVNRNKSKTETEVDSVAKTKEQVVTKTKTVEEVDTSAFAKGSTVKGSTPVKSLDEKPYVLEDENQTITVSKDSTGKLNVTGVVKDRKVDLKFTRTTEEEKKADKTTTVKKQETTTSTTKTTDKEVERSGGFISGLVIVLLILLVFVYLTLRKRFPFLP